MDELDLAACVDLVLHDLATPLGAQQMWLSVLRERSDDPEMRARALDAIERCVQHETRLVQDLRDLSRLLRGDIEAPAAVLSLSRLLAAAIDRAQPLAAEHGCAVDTQLAPGVEMRAHADKLVRTVDLLLEHLVTRARGGRLAITLDAGGGAITCTLARTPVGGLGRRSLALVYARAMVRLHEGTLVMRDDAIELRFAT